MSKWLLLFMIYFPDGDYMSREYTVTAPDYEACMKIGRGVISNPSVQDLKSKGHIIRIDAYCTDKH
jgi:hypothetical protein